MCGSLTLGIIAPEDQNMNSATSTPEEVSAPGQLLPELEAILNRAYQFQQEGNINDALTMLESALAEARSIPDQDSFRTRVMLAMALADTYESNGDTEQACKLLSEERGFAEDSFQALLATGTHEQKRIAAGGLTQLRDRATQLLLIGKEAPELSIQSWINSDPLALEDLCGDVVLLEFWATWCKPCYEMFPKLKQLHDEYAARGLSVIALTRHYFAQRGTVASEVQELDLIRKVVEDNGLDFPVGVARDERVQTMYGATSVPMLALIDRAGIVRYAHFGDGEDKRFGKLLSHCLDEVLE
jgi:thiol-disulfide isomerase/thioredoxin